jgi:succinoglycan biosynthesis protein ExoL
VNLPRAQLRQGAARLALCPGRGKQGAITMTSMIAYLVHDLGDAAVARRVEGLRAGGATVEVAGFYRRAAPASVAGANAVPMGRSHDARLGQRVWLVLRNLIAPGRVKALVRGSDIVVARNLEMLAIGAALARPGQSLVYECLDIHRMMLGSGLASRALRLVERRLLARTTRVIVSSPAFERDYFRRLQGWQGPVDLIENKVSALPADPAPPSAESGPWTIGWFGMLRCRRSLAILSRLAERADGRVRVLVAGIPSPDVFADLPAEIARTPGMEYVGPYRPADLSRLYGRVHFAWCIDYFEEGLNSRWLLPNRLYESLAHGVVPVALADVETGRWLADAGVGLRLTDGEAIGAALDSMTPDRYARLAEAARALPRETIAFSPEDHRSLVRQLEEVGP